jgi:glycerophosphoryl diester phosphodiesterase
MRLLNAKALPIAVAAMALQACATSRPQVAPEDRVDLITGRTVVIAHRGGAGPDGTRASAGRSLKAGVTFIELDVRLTRDGRAVILHDSTVDRTTDGTGAVAEMTLEQVRRLDAGAKYRDPAEPGKSYAGERIPTVREMIRFVGRRGVLLLELKVPEAAERVVASIQQERAYPRVIVRSPDRNVLRRIKELDSRVLVGTMGKMPAANLDAFVSELKELGVASFTAPEATQEQVAAFRSRRIAVWGANTNDPAVMRKLIDAGVDGIITDTCPVLAELLKTQDATRPPLAPLPPDEEEEEPIEVAGLASLRTGLWAIPDFKAMTPAGSREISRTALFDVGMDFSLDVAPFFVQSSFDYALSSELSIISFSVQAGLETDLGKLVVPLSLRASAGVIFAELEVDDSRFGNFDHAVGFLVRAELMGRVSSSVVASLWVDYRQVEFDFDPVVTSGDDTAGGATFAVGLSVGVRF